MKKPLNHSEQLELLKSRGLIIEDEDKCLDFLCSVNYYWFSAYFLPFKQTDGTYTPELTFEKVYRIFEFDRKLRTIIFTVIEEIELYLRSQLAYYSAHTYGQHAYMDAQYYNTLHDHKRFIGVTNSAINNNKNTPVVMHHNTKYGGLFPIWVIIDFFSLGGLSYFYNDWLVKDKKVVAKNLFNTQYTYLDSWLKCITVLRNRCAHYSRLYFSLFTDTPKIPSSTGYVCNGRVFDQLVMLKLLYTDESKWNDVLVNPLIELIDDYNDSITLDHIGFPLNWEDFLSVDS